MSLKTLRAEIQRTADHIRSTTCDRVSLIMIDVVDASKDGGGKSLPCTGYTCDFSLAGRYRRLYFPGQDPEAVANALFDYVHRIERVGNVRPVPVLMATASPPDEALVIGPPAEGITLAEHAARLYDALRAAV